jgi:hypothetical protein
MLNLSIISGKVKKYVNNIVEKHKRELLIGIFLLIIFVGIVGATIYSSMYAQGNISVGA